MSIRCLTLHSVTLLNLCVIKQKYVMTWVLITWQFKMNHLGGTKRHARSSENYCCSQAISSNTLYVESKFKSKTDPAKHNKPNPLPKCHGFREKSIQEKKGIPKTSWNYAFQGVNVKVYSAYIMNQGIYKDKDNSWVAPLPFRVPPHNWSQALLNSLLWTFRKKPKMKINCFEFIDKPGKRAP